MQRSACRIIRVTPVLDLDDHTTRAPVLRPGKDYVWPQAARRQAVCRKQPCVLGAHGIWDLLVIHGQGLGGAKKAHCEPTTDQTGTSSGPSASFEHVPCPEQ